MHAGTISFTQDRASVYSFRSIWIRLTVCKSVTCSRLSPISRESVTPSSARGNALSRSLSSNSALARMSSASISRLVSPASRNVTKLFLTSLTPASGSLFMTYASTVVPRNCVCQALVWATSCAIASASFASASASLGRSWASISWAMELWTNASIFLLPNSVKVTSEPLKDCRAPSYCSSSKRASPRACSALASPFLSPNSWKVAKALLAAESASLLLRCRLYILISTSNVLASMILSPNSPQAIKASLDCLMPSSRFLLPRVETLSMASDSSMAACPRLSPDSLNFASSSVAICCASFSGSRSSFNAAT
mmetsp:Transcript_14723/g.42933  ORF Transcript_14723/g.42933 Transcript_14723/m.42933 type:complete len:311 (-) Transcript_14723:373-1305(-)